jgi:hypothetical protein
MLVALAYAALVFSIVIISIYFSDERFDPQG